MPIDESFRPHLAKLSVEAFEASADVTYIVDGELRLRGYNEAWCEFALKNGGDSVLRQYIIGSSILDAMSPEPRAFYAAAYRHALENVERFDQRFHCPSSHVERELQQSAYPLAGGRGLIITNHLVEERPMARDGKEPSPVYVTSEGLVVQCCHCRRIEDQKIPNKWDWVPHWVDCPHPATSHSFCAACFDFYYGSSGAPADCVHSARPLCAPPVQRPRAARG